MDIKKIIVFLVLLAVLLAMPYTVKIKAQPFVNRLDSLKIQVYNNVGVRSTGTPRLTSGLTGYYLNLAQSVVCDDFDVYVKLDTIVPSATSEWYTLPSDFDRIAEISKMKGDSVRLPLTFIPIDSIRALGSDESDFVYDPEKFLQPAHYTLKNDKLMLYPKYNISPAEDSFLVAYYANPPYMFLSTDALVTEKIIKGVVWKATEMILEIIYEDFAKSDRFKARYESLKGK